MFPCYENCTFWFQVYGKKVEDVSRTDAKNQQEYENGRCTWHTFRK